MDEDAFVRELFLRRSMIGRINVDGLEFGRNGLIERLFQSVQNAGHQRSIHQAMIVSQRDSGNAIFIQRTIGQAAGLNGRRQLYFCSQTGQRRQEKRADACGSFFCFDIQIPPPDQAS